MSQSNSPLVIAHHLMWTLYGWWLPNDLRGSTSRTIHSDLLAELGELHFGRERMQPAGSEIRAFYEQAAAALKYPLLSFDRSEFELVASSIGGATAECNYTCYACAVMPDHVHLVIRRHRDPAETMIERVQALSRKRMIEAGLREASHPTWMRGVWKVFLDHPDEVRRTIKYVNDNPIKMRLPRQHWRWTTPYDNWPLHAGHSPNSPYVKALRRAGRYPC